MKKNSPASAAELRSRAEIRLREQKTEEARPATEPDTQRLLHELQVHQVELEMQNEELMRAREEVEAALERYTDLYDFAPVGYFTLGRDGTIRQANFTGASLLGVERSRLVKRRFELLVAEDARPDFDAFLKRVFQGSAKECCEIALHTDGDKPLIVRIEATACEDGQECRAAMMDITERRGAEAALRGLAAELDRSNSDLAQFAYIAGHDLQEPLHTITGFVELLRDRYKGQLDEKADKYIAYTVDGAKRMQQLIAALLAYCRVGIKGKELVLTDAQEPLARAMENLRFSIEEGGAVITQDAMPTIMADVSQLAQLFQNLIGNALKFRGERLPEIHIGAKRQDDHWLLSVRDNGIGIDPEQADRVFLVFQRLHGRDKYPGSGIGLAICKRIVERHGGRIWVESEVGSGSVFLFTIPAP